MTEKQPQTFETSDFYAKEFEKDPNRVFIEINSQEQEKSYSCGPAIIKNIFDTVGIETTQPEIINEARKYIHEYRLESDDPKDHKKSMAALGTPPEVMEKLLENHGVAIEVKQSVAEINDVTLKEAEEFLNKKLEEGKVIITAIQTIPKYKHERDINEDGHYVTVCGRVTINDKKYFITVDPMFHYYQRISNEGGLPEWHKGEPFTEKAYDTNSTREIEYSEDELNSFNIDPKRYGLRLVQVENFMRNWKDVEGLGEESNLYGIAVEVNN
jgi:hypothetical protein